MGDCLPSAEDMTANDMESDTAAVADIIGNTHFACSLQNIITGDSECD